MGRFLADLPPWTPKAGSYRTDELPHLTFSDGEFDPTLCSRFLYPDKRPPTFHEAGEARVFPLLGAYGSPPPT